MSDDGSHINRQYYCTEAAIPIRSSPSEASEMISQLIFGDFAYHLDQQDNWTQIKCGFDGYEGWVDSKMLRPLSADLDTSQVEWKWSKRASLELLGVSSRQFLPIGSRIPTIKGQSYGVWDPRPQQAFIGYGSSFFEANELENPSHLAKHFLHVPYLWGGCSSYGIDCSGFTQRIFRIMGRKLPRDSRDQEKLGELVPFGKHQTGDLAFFSKPKQEKITHVGLVIENDNIIHASGHVRIDKLTSTGIIHSEVQTLTHELISIKR